MAANRNGSPGTIALPGVCEQDVQRFHVDDNVGIVLLKVRPVTLIGARLVLLEISAGRKDL